MPVLKGKLWIRNHCDFGIEPVPPSREGPWDAYKVFVWKNDVLVFENIYTVSNYFRPHRDLFHMARRFQKAKSLLRLEVPESQEDDGFGRPLRAWPLALRTDTTWLECVMWGGESARGLYFTVVFYLHKTQVDTDTDITDVMAIRIPCLVEDVVQFGGLLEQELIRAREKRKELGIPAEWED